MIPSIEIRYKNLYTDYALKVKKAFGLLISLALIPMYYDFVMGIGGGNRHQPALMHPRRKYTFTPPFLFYL